MATFSHDSLIANALLPMLILLLALVTSEKYTTEEEALLIIKQKWSAQVPTWNSSTDKCKAWEGLKCNTEGKVVYLNLTNKGLKGSIPDELSRLQFLTTLDLSYMSKIAGIPNAVSGDLSILGSLKNLQVLNVSHNNIIGKEFPQEILDLTELVELRLENLFMIGTFPKEIGKLEKLQVLYLGNNLMTGPLPRELGNLIQMRELSLRDIQFNSKIPQELGNLVNLNYLNLNNCTLWGGLPVEFENLRNMEILRLYQNKLTGTVPDSWKAMRNLVELRIQYNLLTGKDFPAWTLEHPTLKSLDISHNQLYSQFPNINNVKFEKLRLECNFFKGPKPPESTGNMNVSNLKTYANCYNDVNTSNDVSDSTCKRSSTCAGFPKTLNAYGCPPCPEGQSFSNASACICIVPQKGPKSKGIVIMILGSIAAFVVIALMIFGFFIYQRANSKARTLSRFKTFMSKGDASKPWDVPKELYRFTYQELSKATSNFSKSNEIGAGGFGKVFIGTLTAGKRVAIKRASLLSFQGGSEFRNEVLLLSRLHHRNLVQLEGFCEEDGLQFLVYEYIPTGNLHSLLSEMKVRSNLSWQKRVEIALGISQGLDYLHSFADPPVIHRDVKPSNILLDVNLVPKLADFGISKATLGSETHISTNPAGTAGYIDPQYFLKGQLTTASDVFGFGVVLLDLITGQKAIDPTREYENNLVEWVKRKVIAEGFKSVVDPILYNTHPDSVFKEITQLAINCSDFERENRPSMKEIVITLETHLQDLSPLSTSQPLSGPRKILVETHNWDSPNYIQEEITESSTQLHTVSLLPR